ncbi:hypothetical protein K432DRAFT_387677 [Lepidopterella palustris CBS 459.81]|uniref:RNase III domain-containing protein n=1 Tax=Lepidopterella palustris CBS 459.81 TaxID=1314670 RepID=A0A8E2DW46_9PEZI|nr:hypothetical protein K432DRAFT_387677 [Lepidopterella palustris CBS 459.81]
MPPKPPLSLLSTPCHLPRPSIRKSSPRTTTRTTTPSTASFTSTSHHRLATHDTDAAPRPRWQTTPARMVAPFRTRPAPAGPVWKVNDDPHRLDAMYIRMLGKEGDKMLSEEVKWLAVTHKSFDHGRRGFNDRLAFLGRRIITLRANLALLNSPPPLPTPDAYNREPFTHPALTGLLNLSPTTEAAALDKTRLAAIAQRYGIDKVTRWKPKKADNLQGSGVEAVMVTSLYAIVGAVALEKGGEVANRIVKQAVLSPLGLV